MLTAIDQSNNMVEFPPLASTYPAATKLTNAVASVEYASPNVRRDRGVVCSSTPFLHFPVHSRISARAVASALCCSEKRIRRYSTCTLSLLA